MNKLSLVILLPIGALLAGVVFSTFVHKYDTTRNLFQDRNLTIEDLSGTQGNIISLQKDISGNPIWIVFGKWELDVKPRDNSTGRINTIDFGSNLTMKKLDGLKTDKVSLSNLTLMKSQVMDEIAILDGTVSLINTGNSLRGVNETGQNITIPLHIVISNGRTISISSDSELFRKYFGVSPVYGNIPQRD